MGSSAWRWPSRYYVTRIINFAQVPVDDGDDHGDGGELSAAGYPTWLAVNGRPSKPPAVLGVLLMLIVVRPILVDQPFQLRLAQSVRSGFAVIVENARGLYLGPDVAGLSANAPKHDELSSARRCADRSSSLPPSSAPPSSPLGSNLCADTRYSVRSAWRRPAADPEMATAHRRQHDLSSRSSPSLASALYAGVAGLSHPARTHFRQSLSPGDTLFGTFGFIAMDDRRGHFGEADRRHGIRRRFCSVSAPRAPMQ